MSTVQHPNLGLSSLPDLTVWRPNLQFSSSLDYPQSGLRRKSTAKPNRLSVTSSGGTPLCPYGIAYRRFNRLSTFGLFQKSLRSEQCCFESKQCVFELSSLVSWPNDVKPALPGDPLLLVETATRLSWPIPLICATSRRILASASKIQGSERGDSIAHWRLLVRVALSCQMTSFPNRIISSFSIALV